MQFVKTSVIHQEITKDGIKNYEVDALPEDERKQKEILKQLPEFNRDRTWRSLSEQIHEDDHEPSSTTQLPSSEPAQKIGTLDKEESSNISFGPPPVTEDEFEFIQALESQRKKRLLCRKQEEDFELSQFREAQGVFSSIQSDSLDTTSKTDSLSQQPLGPFASGKQLPPSEGPTSSSQRNVPSVLSKAKTALPKPKGSGTKIGAILVKKRKVKESVSPSINSCVGSSGGDDKATGSGDVLEGDNKLSLVGYTKTDENDKNQIEEENNKEIIQHKED